MKLSRKVGGALLCLGVVLGGMALYNGQNSRLPGGMRLYSDTRLMEQEVGQRIAVGSDIKRAKTIMEQNGFGCGITTNGHHESHGTFEKAARTGQPTTLDCHRKTTFLVSNSWGIHFNYTGRKITSFFASFRSTASDL